MQLKNIFKLLLSLLAIQFIQSCSKVFDKQDISAISSGNVWNDVNLSTAYVNTLYRNLPAERNIAFSS